MTRLRELADAARAEMEQSGDYDAETIERFHTEMINCESVHWRRRSEDPSAACGAVDPVVTNSFGFPPIPALVVTVRPLHFVSNAARFGSACRACLELARKDLS